MRYKRYGKDGPLISRLGFGAMRFLPRKGGGWGSVNFTKSTEVLLKAFEQGVNFVDSHHFYHKGLSELAIGKVLKKWKGHRIYIQTKTPIYQHKPLAEFKKLIEQALEKLGVQQIDYLLFHMMTAETFKKRAKIFFKLTDWAMKKGYILHRGFSSHETPENIKTFIDTGEFEVMLVSYNYLKPEMRDVIAYGAQKGMGVTVMNPVGGGSLAINTKPIMRLLPTAKSAAEIALRYVLDTPGVTAALSGMNTVEQVLENTRIASRKHYLTQTQRAIINKGLKRFKTKSAKICTSCGYCMPCPYGVDIPQNFMYLNRALFLDIEEQSMKDLYTRLKKWSDTDKTALACRKCGSCLPKCPNNVPIIEQMQKLRELIKKYN